jgi:3-hydroxyisobutyrate dehydrogenase-like beta-hydroxyacid dehydrogenase
MLPAVGWIGLGRIGTPMAQRVAAAGLPLAVWSRRPRESWPALSWDATAAADPESLARSCDLVATIVGGPADVSELHRRMIPHARPGTVFVEMTTAAPDNATESGALARRAGVHVLDAPVTGGVAGAQRGTLTAFAGGDTAALERARPLLDAFCSRVVHCGDHGTGYRMKLVNQTMIAGVLLGLAAGASLARAGGIDAAAVKSALGTGTASGVLFDSYVERMVVQGGAATFTLAMLRKDLALARAESASRNASTALADFAIGQVDAAIARHGPEAGVQFLAADAR